MGMGYERGRCRTSQPTEGKQDDERVTATKVQNHVQSTYSAHDKGTEGTLAEVAEEAEVAAGGSRE